MSARETYWTSLIDARKDCRIASSFAGGIELDLPLNVERRTQTVLNLRDYDLWRLLRSSQKDIKAV